MALSFSALPGEILVTIIEDCDTKELLSLALTSKRFSRIVPAKLYRHLYFRHIPSQEALETDSLDSSENDYPSADDDKRLGTQRSWKYEDPVFNDENIRPSSTWIKDLSKLSSVISKRHDFRGFMSTIRLDIQSRNAWCPPENYWRLHQGGDNFWPWTSDESIEDAIWSIKNDLSHLPYARACFGTQCAELSDDLLIPRMVQTLGMPLPFLLVFPKIAVRWKSQCQHNPQNVVVSTELPALQSFILCQEEQTDYTSNPQLILRKQPQYSRDDDSFTLVHYTGPLMNLHDYLGAPHELQSYRRWLAAQPSEVSQINPIRAFILHSLRNILKFVDSDYEDSASDEFMNHVIGDTSYLDFDSPPPKGINKSSKDQPLEDLRILYGF